MTIKDYDLFQLFITLSICYSKVIRLKVINT